MCVDYSEAMTEKQLQKMVVRYVRCQYKDVILFHVPNAGKRSTWHVQDVGILHGVSDLILIYKGKLLALELKIPGNKPTEYQQVFLDDIKKNEFDGYWTDNLDVAQEIIDRWVSRI